MHAARRAVPRGGLRGRRPAASGSGRVPAVTLFTRPRCSLCDEAALALAAAAEGQGLRYHLEQVDITAPGREAAYAKYKWDVPVFFLDGAYWAKHRLEAEEAARALGEAAEGRFAARDGEPDSSHFKEV
eukprot:TRINITY_DN66439_c0_g1_i1.p2 TRINITY_DN66439_c0_g1~~TRINITY_DN66439_c0_g1_i1.p2  ORF type:complete len:129 (+),score=38.77 TRINITY_DN66439_c0_g1_i1:91-477(+)